MNSKTLVTIFPEILGADQSHPFTIYLLPLGATDFEIFLPANIPLTSKQLEYLKEIQSKGAKIAVSASQKKTLSTTTITITSQPLEEIQTTTELKAHQINKHIMDQVTTTHEIIKHSPIPAAPPVAEVKEIKVKKKEQIAEKEEDKKRRMKETEEKNDKLNLSEIFQLLKKASKEDDFSLIVEIVRDEIMDLPANLNQTTSNVRFLAQSTMNEDNTNNRIAALTYLLALKCGIKQSSELANLVGAALLHDIGMTQLDALMVTKNAFNYTPEERKEYEKHPGLSHHLIRKSGIKLDKQCIDIILDHHEKADGSGFPLHKSERGIEPLSQYLSLVDHTVHYAYGTITGRKGKVNSVAKRIAQQTASEGLQLDFNPHISEIFAGMFE